MPNYTSKATKAEVNYRLGGRVCGGCKYFSEDDDGDEEVSEGEGETGWCSVVKGKIDELGECDEFKRARPGLVVDAPAAKEEAAEGE